MTNYDALLPPNQRHSTPSTKMTNSPALIFDLDGTLVDTAPDLLGALNAILTREGRRNVEYADLRHLVGFGAGTMMTEAFKMTGDAVPDERVTELVTDYVDHYRANIAVASKPFPGVDATLARLASGGARMGVLTNKPQELTDLLLPALSLDRHFAAVYGAGRMSYTKPDARIFHDVVADLGGPGAGAIMIGDSATDVATARAAGRPVILVSYGYTPEPAHMLGADAVTDDFAEIPSLVERLL
jgi:phosphoglycolate phosphatase